MASRREAQGCPVDMTPMIDVVFQLIIFFIVTITMQQEKNEDIILERAKYGPEVKSQEQATVIEVDQRGWISMHGAKLSAAQLANMMQSKMRRTGRVFPVLIRGDYRTKHEDIRAVMDICTGVGIWQIDFAAIKKKIT